MSPVRVRQHVNPLSQKFQAPIDSVDWAALYAQPQHPLHLDLGCGRGQFLLRMAELQPKWNFLGLEIRQPLVEQANALRQQMQLTNLHYLFGNANHSLTSLLQSQSVQGITIQFPDPWFKRRHQKRRLVQPRLVEDLAAVLQRGGFLFIQSDVLEIASEMRDHFMTHPQFQDLNSEQWLATNPLPVPTERELSVLERGLPVYRALFIRV